MSTHWKSYMDRDYIFAFDLNGKDVTVTIAKVVAGTLVGQGGRKAKKPILYFDGKEKGLALNSTNAKIIAALFGNFVEKWIGQSITLYPTTTTMGSDTVDCIRVRPNAPKSTGRKQVAASDPESIDLDEALEIQRREAEEAARGS